MTVFLSYAHQDAATVDLLRRDIEELSGTVWLDTSLSGGQLWWDEILRQIRDCELFVLALSHHSLRSEACLSESGYAADLGRTVLATRIDDVDIVSVPEAIRRTQLIDYRAEDPASIRALAKALMRIGRPSDLPSPLPPLPPLPESYRDRFAALFGATLSMDDQVALFARLSRDVSVGLDDLEARELLSLLYDRPDVAWTVRRDIEGVLGDSVPAPAPPSTQSPRQLPQRHTVESASVAPTTGLLRITRGKNTIYLVGERYSWQINGEEQPSKIRNGETVEAELLPGVYDIGITSSAFSGTGKRLRFKTELKAGRVTQMELVQRVGGLHVARNEVT